MMKDSEASVQSNDDGSEDLSLDTMILTKANGKGTFDLRSSRASFNDANESLTNILRKLRDIGCATLEFREMDLSNCVPALKEYMRSTECVKKLEINTSRLGGARGIGDFFSSLHRNMTIQTLSLFGVDELESSGSALRDLLRRNRSLQNLSFSCNDLNTCAPSIAQGLQQNKMLHTISFDGCDLRDNNFQEIIHAISSDRCGVQEVLTNDNPLTIVSLSQALDATKGKNASLRAIYFGFSSKVFTEDSGEWKTVARFVEEENRSTTRLRDFSLEGCDVPDDACRSLIKALETNTFLNFFAIDIENAPSLVQLLETLPKMKSLQQLVISNYAKLSSLHNFEEQFVDAISKNKTLYRFKFESFMDAEPLSDEAQRKIQFHVLRNRLEPLHTAPEKVFRQSMWPFVLESLSGFDAGPSAIYYSLSKKIDLLPQRVNRKRGRESCQIQEVVEESIRRRCTRIDYL
eukprot:scaffold448_cov156-Amphora_coffeaeformis.AAC.10